MADVEAVIVAGGLGTRLRPLTQHLPKHLLPVAGVPFVAHQLAKLAAAGVRRVVLATSYQAEMFEPVLGDGSRWGVELTYVTEREPLGTAGAIRNVADVLETAPEAPVVILNGDILSTQDLRGQLAFHEERQADVSLHLVDVPDPRAYGCVPTDDKGNVLDFMEKSPDPVSHQINAGTYVFTRRVIDEIPVGRVVSVERETFPGLLAAGRRLVGYVEDGYWLDLGTPEALVRASADLVRGIATSPAYPHDPAEARIDPEASVAKPAWVRGGSSIGPGARVSPGAVVEASVVAAGAAVGEGSRVIESVVGPDARVGARVVLERAIVGDRAVVGDGCELVAGARVWCDTTIPDGAIRFSSDL